MCMKLITCTRVAKGDAIQFLLTPVAENLEFIKQNVLQTFS